MVAAQEYLVTDKIFFGADYPFSTVKNSLRGIRAVNDVALGTRLPRVRAEVIEGVVHANPFEHWWRRPPPGNNVHSAEGQAARGRRDDRR